MTGFPSIDKVHLRNIPENELNPEVFPYSMYETFLRWNEGYMEGKAIYDSNGEYSKSELKDKVEELVKSFLMLGMSGDNESVIAMAMPNSLKAVAIVMAANSIGIKIFFLDYLEDAEKVLEKAKKYGAQYCFLQKSLNEYGIMYSCSGKVGARSLSYFSSVLSEEFKGDYKKVMEKYSSYDKPLIFLNTSGSTSEPKVLPFTNEAIYAAMVFALNSTGINNRDTEHCRLMTLLSIRLPFGFMTGFLPILWGSEVVFASGVTPEDIANYYKYEASYIFGTPTLLQAFMGLTPKDADLSPLLRFYSSGFSTPEELFPAAEAFFAAHNSKAKLCNNYGFGEGLGIGTASDQVKHVPGTSGELYRGPKFLIVDDEMNEVKYGEVGELIVNSPSLCKGYLDNPQATEEAFVKLDGVEFFKTGDYVSVDEDGYVRYLGRKKRFYQPLGAGDKVSCEAIEKLLYTLDFVKQAAVVPVSDPEKVTVGKAFVVINDGVNEFAAKANIESEFEKSLKSFQIPNEIVFLNELPLMASGKINYLLLQKM